LQEIFLDSKRFIQLEYALPVAILFEEGKNGGNAPVMLPV